MSVHKNSLANLSQFRHGHAVSGRESPEWKSWSSMLHRCRNPGATFYRRYGGRGIRVCERWTVFENFLADMGHRPEGLTLERKNNDGNYEPENCCWATRKEQRRNRSDVRRYAYKGKQLSIAEIADINGIPLKLVSARLKRGWTPEESAMAKRLHKYERTHSL